VPKINVYLPDDLADAVRDSGVPVSAVCQRALEQAVRRVTAIREIAVGDLDPEAATGPLSRFTGRARTALRLAADRARAAGAPAVGTAHLLGGVLAEGGNLALHVLRAVDVDPDQVRRALDGRTADPAEESAAPAADGGARFSAPAANALELTVTEAVAFGHNYVGCEHLLLGLVTEPDGAAGQVLRSLGAEQRLTRRAVAAALAGYVHLRAQAAEGGAASAADPAAALAEAVRREVAPLAERIARLEERSGLASDG
jgi:ATP-dependent Clp protease ATP-binding subunit ClpC